MGAFVFNLAAMALPAVYGTLSKMWVANIDSSRVATTDAWTYMSIVAEVINEGMPRAAWVTIGDKSSRSLVGRLQLTHTLVAVQAVLGLLLSLVFVAGASTFAKGFVPVEIRSASITYIRLTAFCVLSSAVEVAVASSTRALDMPDISLLISSVKFSVNILLDILFLSNFRIGNFEPTVNTKGAIQLICSLSSSLAGLSWFLYKVSFQHWGQLSSILPSTKCLGILIRPGIPTMVESAVRNALFLWLVSTIVAMGSTYATAWGVLSTIQWGVITIPIQALEATTLTFVGHRWGQWRRNIGTSTRRAQASWLTIRSLFQPVILGIGLAVAIVDPICLFLSNYGIRPFAMYLSNSEEVTEIAVQMWRTLVWCYSFLAVGTPLAAVLLATRPKWYMCQSFGYNFLYVLPWAIACQRADMTPANAWSYHGLVFGGSIMVFFLSTVVVDAIWIWDLKTGRTELDTFRGS
jgi:Na+-driven multidrug efflux pump